MRRLGFDTVFGLIAGSVGLLGWFYALFGPTGRYERVESSSNGGATVTESGWTSMWGDEDLETVTIVFLLVMLLSILGVLAGTILHDRTRQSSARAILWVSAVTLLAGTILSMFSVGLFLLPAAVLAVTAAVLASTASDGTQRHTAS